MYQPIHTGRRAGRAHWIHILAAAGGLCACVVGWPDPAAAQTDTDGDGLSDAEEVSRVRTVPFGPQQVITTVANGAFSIFAADLDGDGDPDALSASEIDDKIAWYENRLDEASADFGPQRVITTAADNALSVFAADLDGDGDPDVLSASFFDDKIAWYENRLDEASADFGPQRVITTAANGAFSVFAADLDGDGDPDVLSASRFDDKIAWYENRLDEASADFGPQQVITTAANSARSVFAVDLDGDGDPDVLSASPDDDKIAWYENRLDEASADFGPQRVITTAADNALSVFAADLDGDGDPDVLSASFFDDKIAWYENRLDEASADFGPQRVITTAANGAFSVFAADLDGDGDTDVLSASAGDDKIAWYENRLDEASADFGPQQVITTAADVAFAVFAADLDGDGDPDVLSGSFNDDKIAWYENPGTNPLDPDTDDDGLSDGDEVNVYSTDPLDPDSDDDGILDGDEVNVHGTDPNDPDSDDDGLSDGEEVNVHGTDPNHPDSDGDGLLDPFEVANGFDPLVGGDETQDPDLDGLDNFAEQAAGTDPLDPDTDHDGLSDGDEVNVRGTDPLDPDSDGDGLLDGFEVAHGFNPLLGGEETQDPDLDGLDNLGEQTAGTDPHDADTDDDGLSDAEEVSRVRTVPFGPQQVITTAADNALSVFAADLDGDGDPDALSASGRDDKIAWYENRLDEASADFGPQQVITTAADGAFSVFAADLDGDGDPDALSASRSDDKIAWHENRLDEASADFGPQRVITTAADNVLSVFAADLDGDGDPDVLSASFADDKIAWYENRLDEASADFGPQQLITPSSSVQQLFSVFAADLDGDGDPDVLSASADDDKIAWYENRLDEASADFGPQQVITTAADRARSVFAADLDGDGDPDVLSASSGDDKIAWYENRLDEVSADFGPQQAITTAADGAFSVFAADLDGDGDPDVLSASRSDDKIAWYENRLDEASADFGPQQLITTAANGARSVFAADLDGDGDPDALSASESDNKIAWYENPGTNPLDPDTDDDGLSDGDEVNVHGTNPGDPDSDDDGLLDGEEVNVHGTEPLDPDTDGDGLSDSFEVVNGFNPLLGGEETQDPDADDLDNLAEQAAGTDPNDADTDADGLLDGFEVANRFNPLLGGEETQDPDSDGLDNLAEQTAGTDPFDPDSDDDGLSDGDEVNVHATDPLDRDSDDDGTSDRVEIIAGTDPNDPSDFLAPGSRLPMLYKGNLSLYRRVVDYRGCHQFGCYTVFVERPLGRPLVGSGTANATLNALGSSFSFTLPSGGLYLETPSLSRTLPPVQNGSTSIRVRTHPNASLANDSGFFGPGGGPGSHDFAYGAYPRWSITPGANQFGGTLRLLGAIDEARNLRLTGTGTVDFYAHAPNPFSALGGRCTATTGCPSLPVSQASRVVQYYTSLKNLYTTALVRAWGYAWTTGRVFISAPDNAYLDTRITRSGYDNRTPLGQGVIQLVSPHIAHWNFASLPLDRATGAIAILNIEIRFVPEPKGWLMLASGIGLLGVFYWRRR